MDRPKRFRQFLVFIPTALIVSWILVVLTVANMGGSHLMFPITMESVQFQWVYNLPATDGQRYCGPCWSDEKGLPVIYVITPTYRRPEQMAELTRLGQTLLHVPAIRWVVVEDSESISESVAGLLARLSIPYIHLSAPMPTQFRKDRISQQPRGVSNRMAALDWIRQNGIRSGVIYFADDDNTYDIRLFEEMRYTKKVSMWPVGLIARFGVSSPVLDEDGFVVDFYDVASIGRMFGVDMAAFAVNVRLFLETNGTMPYIAGFEEDGFLQSLGLNLKDIEPKADGCTQVLVWHTKSQVYQRADQQLALHDPRFKGTNIERLQSQVV